MNRVVMYYTKEMQDYDYMRHTWKEIVNINIVNKLEGMVSKLEEYKFTYKVKTSRYDNRKGKIIIKSTLPKNEVLLLVGRLFAGELLFNWR